MNTQPKVGVGVIIVKDSKVLLGQRKNAHGQGSWSFPGGHLEYQETIEDCAKREVLEETDLEIKDIRKLAFTNDVFLKEAKHYVTLFVIAKYASGTLKIKEPHKCVRWDWFNWDQLPSPLFLPIQNLLKEHKDSLQNIFLKQKSF